MEYSYHVPVVTTKRKKHFKDFQRKVQMQIDVFFARGKEKKLLRIIDYLEQTSLQSSFVPKNEIQKDFFETSQRIFTESKQIIVNKMSEIDKNILKVHDGLTKLGFRQAKPVVDCADIMLKKRLSDDKRKASQNLLNALIYFSTKYPQYKFITEENVLELCKKYNLYLGNVDIFTGSIPEANIQDILVFHIDMKDRVYLVRGRERSFNEAHVDHTSPISTNFQIAAPLKDFDTRNVLIFSESRELIELPAKDPIVFCPVMFKDVKYYLIVTAWDEEASDPLVVNERFN